MKVYDCFTFYNEFELLELRLKTLYDAVDYFVIVEANRKHNGQAKELNLLNRREVIKDFMPKIRYIAADFSRRPFKGVGDWALEHAQRDEILKGLNGAEPDDLILISDLDEIPAPNLLQRLNDDKITLHAPEVTPVTVAHKDVKFPAQLLVPASRFLEYGALVLTQTLHYYYFDWIAQGEWHGTILTKRKNLTMPQELRDLREFLPRVEQGGYHFSYMGGIDRVIEKISSIRSGNLYVHRSGGKFIERKHVEESMANGKDIYGRSGLPESQFIPYDVNNIKLPGLHDFLRKYPQFLREPEKYFGEND